MSQSPSTNKTDGSLSAGLQQELRTLGTLIGDLTAELKTLKSSIHEFQQSLQGALASGSASSENLSTISPRDIYNYTDVSDSSYRIAKSVTGLIADIVGLSKIGEIPALFLKGLAEVFDFAADDEQKNKVLDNILRLIANDRKMSDDEAVIFYNEGVKNSKKEGLDQTGFFETMLVLSHSGFSKEDLFEVTPATAKLKNGMNLSSQFTAYIIEYLKKEIGVENKHMDSAVNDFMSFIEDNQLQLSNPGEWKGRFKDEYNAQEVGSEQKKDLRGNDRKRNHDSVTRRSSDLQRAEGILGWQAPTRYADHPAEDNGAKDRVEKRFGPGGQFNFTSEEFRSIYTTVAKSNRSPRPDFIVENKSNALKVADEIHAILARDYKVMREEIDAYAGKLNDPNDKRTFPEKQKDFGEFQKRSYEKFDKNMPSVINGYLETINAGKDVDKGSVKNNAANDISQSTSGNERMKTVISSDEALAASFRAGAMVASQIDALARETQSLLTGDEVLAASFRAGAMVASQIDALARETQSLLTGDEALAASFRVGAMVVSQIDALARATQSLLTGQGLGGNGVSPDTSVIMSGDIVNNAQVPGFPVQGNQVSQPVDGVGYAAGIPPSLFTGQGFGGSGFLSNTPVRMSGSAPSKKGLASDIVFNAKTPDFSSQGSQVSQPIGGVQPPSANSGAKGAQRPATPDINNSLQRADKSGAAGVAPNSGAKSGGLQSPGARGDAARGAKGAAGNMTIHYNPTFNLPMTESRGSLEDIVSQLSMMSLAKLKRLLQDHNWAKGRQEYGSL